MKTKVTHHLGHEYEIEIGEPVVCQKRKHPHLARHASNTAAYARAYNLFRSYQMTGDDVAYLMQLNDSCCALCDEPFFFDKPCVDHSHVCPNEANHTRGKSGTLQESFGCPSCIRGLLCRNCNIRVGFIERAIELGEAKATETLWGYLMCRPLVSRTP